MYDFIVGMLLGSLLTVVPLLVWDRLARSRAAHDATDDIETDWRAMRARTSRRA